ncbi:hypothetical protein DSCA_19970 [Desulfosarcina alkanivorans]|uniref:Uncharacterized protein n=1 Tax=Desulfosarcina alkanivorans TaxID=571177 RepID=A0A5K7YTS8_9BACT|nr:hypothetical protein [Desulfosarcina alkanivorans]BBO68067.1 hypothetical protein DSCA_19970 [Desulfosarcina alkanivorans]
MNHGICHICGTLFKPFASNCSVFGFEGLPDCIDWMPDERNFSEGTSDSFTQEQWDQDLDEVALSNRN